MYWYSVRVLLKFTYKGQPKKFSLFEDRIMLVKAQTHSKAQAKAARIVKKEEHSYKTVDGRIVRWRLATVYESVELHGDPLGDGTEVYWRYINSSDPVKRLKREGTMNGYC